MKKVLHAIKLKQVKFTLGTPLDRFPLGLYRLVLLIWVELFCYKLNE